jgi:hypothetical protein
MTLLAHTALSMTGPAGSEQVPLALCCLADPRPCGYTATKASCRLPDMDLPSHPSTQHTLGKLSALFATFSEIGTAPC